MIYSHVYNVKKALNKENINSKLRLKENKNINSTILRATDMFDGVNKMKDIVAIEDCLKELKAINKRCGMVNWFIFLPYMYRVFMCMWCTTPKKERSWIQNPRNVYSWVVLTM